MERFKACVCYCYRNLLFRGYSYDLYTVFFSYNPKRSSPRAPAVLYNMPSCSPAHSPAEHALCVPTWVRYCIIFPFPELLNDPECRSDKDSRSLLSPFTRNAHFPAYNLSDIFINVPLNSREIMHRHLDGYLFLSAANLRPSVPHLPALVVFYWPVTGFQPCSLRYYSRCILCLALFLSHSFTFLFEHALLRNAAVKEKFTCKWKISHHLLNLTHQRCTWPQFFSWAQRFRFFIRNVAPCLYIGLKVLKLHKSTSIHH